jgi:putative intracellular protease/amidase
MYDLAVDSESQQLIKEFYESGKVVSAVCHGPAALVNVKLSDGTHLVKGQEVAAFTDAEEEQVGLTKAVPFLLESSLASNGAKIVKADAWQPKVVTSGKNGKLITGQNPASAGPIGEAILAAL